MTALRQRSEPCIRLILSSWRGFSSPLPSRSTFSSRPSRSGSRASSRCWRGCWLWTKREEYRELYRFWIKIFAVSFGMGVVSGVVMSYQFGLNWSRFSDAGGAVLGPLLAYEVLTAFFLEAGFLGIMLFGWNKVGRGLHFFATCMVAVGTLVSAFWILSANSWMQTPAGLRHRRRPLRAGRLARDHLQPVLPLPARPHVARRLSQHGVRGRRGRGLASAARPPRSRRQADVLDGHVDGGDRGADPDPGRRPARPEHARASAGQGRRDGRRLRHQEGPAARPLRHARHEGRDDEVGRRDPEARQPHPDPLARWRGQGAEGVPGAGPPLRADRLLELPRHGRAGLPDGAHRLRLALAALQG